MSKNNNYLSEKEQKNLTESLIQLAYDFVKKGDFPNSTTCILAVQEIISLQKKCDNLLKLQEKNQRNNK